jgi:adenosylmethionine-8-amino-7-oxononanoate aminotransferase
MPNISQMQASDPHVLGVPVSASKSSRVFHRKLDHKPLFIERAEGIYLYEEGSGRRLMDGCGGAAVVSVGHCVPEIVEGVRKQLEQLSYITSATFAHRVSFDQSQR